ncbi:hypothetical protein JL720_6043 [Aureococcus anophagefferens]|nr:hypothetical protein JL720_6043 [Aureococcus anophagefferens]
MASGSVTTSTRRVGVTTVPPLPRDDLDGDALATMLPPGEPVGLGGERRGPPAKRPAKGKAPPVKSAVPPKAPPVKSAVPPKAPPVKSAVPPKPAPAKGKGGKEKRRFDCPKPASSGEALEVEKSRLLTRDTVFLGRSAKKALLKFQAFANAADSRGAEASTDDKVAGLRAGATHELRLLAIEVRKARLANAACAREMEECAALEAETAAKIEATKVNIARLQGELRSERRVRERKEEYESLAKIINGVPPKVASTKAIAGLEADTIDDLQRADEARDEEAEKNAAAAAAGGDDAAPMDVDDGGADGKRGDAAADDEEDGEVEEHTSPKKRKLSAADDE